MSNNLMSFAEYQAEAARTGGDDLHPDRQMQGLVCAALGLAGEAAEIMAVVLHPNAYRHDDFVREIGDVLWYAAHLCNVLKWRFSGVTPPDVGSVGSVDLVSRRWDIIRYFHEDHCFASRGSDDAQLSVSAKVSAMWVMIYAGHIADATKKVAFYGQPLEAHLHAINFALNNLMVNLVLACEAGGLRLDGAARTNVEKLRKRYPNGFTTEASVARHDESP